MSFPMREYCALTKPRVVALIVFTALVGMFLAVPGLPPLREAVFGLLGIWLAAASAAAINHLIDQRIRDNREDVARLRGNRILIDADPETKQRKLLQIFTQNAFGPIFFEIIQRKGNEGFGEGNFQALFESIERDQMKRGVL